MLHVDFTKAPLACSECHEDPHGKQFADKESDCASCHNSNKWKPSLFDHEKTAFSLKGGHEGVPCADCHKLKKEIEGKDVLFYKPTPVACEACHGTDIPKVPQKSALNPAPEIMHPGAGAPSAARLGGPASKADSPPAFALNPWPLGLGAKFSFHATESNVKMQKTSL